MYKTTRLFNDENDAEKLAIINQLNEIEKQYLSEIFENILDEKYIEKFYAELIANDSLVKIFGYTKLQSQQVNDLLLTGELKESVASLIEHPIFENPINSNNMPTEFRHLVMDSSLNDEWKNWLIKDNGKDTLETDVEYINLIIEHAIHHNIKGEIKFPEWEYIRDMLNENIDDDDNENITVDLMNMGYSNDEIKSKVIDVIVYGHTNDENEFTLENIADEIPQLNSTIAYVWSIDGLINISETFNEKYHYGVGNGLEEHSVKEKVYNDNMSEISSEIYESLDKLSLKEILDFEGDLNWKKVLENYFLDSDKYEDALEQSADISDLLIHETKMFKLSEKFEDFIADNGYTDNQIDEAFDKFMDNDVDYENAKFIIIDSLKQFDSKQEFIEFLTDGDVNTDDGDNFVFPEYIKGTVGMKENAVGKLLYVHETNNGESAEYDFGDGLTYGIM